MRAWQRVALNGLRKGNVRRLHSALRESKCLHTLISSKQNIQQLRSSGLLSNGAAKSFLRLARSLTKIEGRHISHCTRQSNPSRCAHVNKAAQRRKFSSNDPFGNFKPKNGRQGNKQSKSGKTNEGGKGADKKGAGRGAAAEHI